MLMICQSPPLVKDGPQNRLSNMSKLKLSRDTAPRLMSELSEVIMWRMYETNSRVSASNGMVWDNVAGVFRDSVLVLTTDVNDWRITVKFPNIAAERNRKPISWLCNTTDIMRRMDQVVLTVYQRKWLVWRTELIQEHLPMHFCDDEGHTIKVDLTPDAKSAMAHVIVELLKDQQEQARQHELQQQIEQDNRAWAVITELKNKKYEDT